MFTFLKRPLYVLSNKIRGELNPQDKTPQPGTRWTADFSSPENSHFDIKSENSYNAYLETGALPEEKKFPLNIPHKLPFKIPLNFLRKDEKETGALVLGLKKANHLAWVTAPDLDCQDQLIEARIDLDRMGGYAAAGIMFRMVEESTYYRALVSSKGYFRLDTVRNNKSLPLVGWTELPNRTSGESSKFDLTIIVLGNNFIFLINDCWVAEISDSSITSGACAFALVSYESGDEHKGTASGTADSSGEYVCSARLEKFSVDTRVDEIERHFKKWDDGPQIRAESRLLLAETFAAMGRAADALHQIRKAWEQREEAARSVSATYTEMRARRELLMAARMATMLGQYEAADEFINACLEQGFNNAEGKDALVEKANLLYQTGNFEKLQAFVLDNLSNFENGPIPYSLLGHAFWNQKDYSSAAAAYDMAFNMDTGNGTNALNAAAAYQAMGRKYKTLERYLAAGRAFLDKEKYEELGELIPEILSAGQSNWEAHALAGKWAFGVEDFERAEAEFILSDKFRNRLKKKRLPDPAVCFLRGLTLIRKGQREAAFDFLEEAVRLAPGYGLFHFRLAESRFLFTQDPNDPQVEKELQAALRCMPDDGWVNNFAAQVKLAAGDHASAEKYLEKASQTLGDAVAIRVNRGVFYYLKGSLDDALKILDADKRDDPDGLMANTAGNLLVRSGNYEKAEQYYCKAMSIAPRNTEYLCNRASCLIKLGFLGQAEELLAAAPPSPEIYELLSYANQQKGDYSQAEAASLAALELKPDNLPSLFSLGWIYCNTSRWSDLKKILARMSRMKLSGEDLRKARELHQRLEQGMFKIVHCASCSRKWKIKRSSQVIPPIKLHAMLPDDYPAGTCPDCGKTYCIGCAKKHIDKNKRFICPQCGKNLKLSDEGLKRMLYDWANTNNK